MNIVKLTGTGLLAMLIAGAGAAQTADPKMRSLTSNVLAGINGIKEPKTPVEAAEPGDIQEIVQQAIAEGQSDEYLEALLEEAVEKGEIEITDGLRTTDGEVDTRTLLSTLVKQSLDGETEEGALEAEAAVGEDRYHVVEPGDSLAAIALQYYQNAQDYPRIFEANRDQVSRPDLINVGQRLLIPG